MPPQINEKPPRKRGLTGAPLTTKEEETDKSCVSLLRVLDKGNDCLIWTFEYIILVVQDIFNIFIHLWEP